MMYSYLNVNIFQSIYSGFYNLFGQTHKWSLVACIAISTVAVAQKREISIKPGITIGYTFKKGINCGIEISTYFFSINNPSFVSNHGLAVSLSYFNVKNIFNNSGMYRVISFNLANSINNTYLFMIGMAKTRVKWGYMKVNETHSNGWGMNIDFSMDVYKNCFLGFRYFQLKNRCIGLDFSNVKFLYAAYRYGFIYPY